MWHEEQHAGGEEEGWEELNADGDEPGGVGLRGAGAAYEVRCVADPVGDLGFVSCLGQMCFERILTIMPKVIASCWSATSDPLTSGGASSAL